MASKNRDFREPPLAFSGNKKYWAAELMDEAALLPAGATVWDVFGGSGVCARCIKDARPDVRVIWNDFDNYSERLRHIAESEELRKTLYRRFGGIGDASPQDSDFCRPLSSDEARAFHEACVAHHQRFGFFDDLLARRWSTIGVPKGFYDLNNPPKVLYSKVPRRPLKVAEAERWLDGLEITRCEASQLPIQDGDFVILDPPYVETACSEYRGSGTLPPLRDAYDILRRCKFILFGDASISFFYEIMTEKFAPRLFVKDGIVAAMRGAKRSEVMYSNW